MGVTYIWDTNTAIYYLSKNKKTSLRGAERRGQPTEGSSLMPLKQTQH